MSFNYFSKNGKVLSMNNAVVPIENINFQYGFGVYETLKVRNGILYFVKQHIDRLLFSAKIISLEHEFEKPKIDKYIRDLIETNKIESANIKMLLMGAKTARDAELFILPLAPLYPDRKLYSKGATVMTVEYERFLPNAKTLNMLPSYLFYTKAKSSGCYDALFKDKEKNILEGTRTNFFAIKDNNVITPPTNKVLEGVTRMTVIDCASKNGYKIEEKNIPYSDLSKYDGAFVTSTSSKIVPLIQIDDYRYNEISDSIKRLIKLYDNFLDESKGVF